jgi:hypothetical protein
MWKRVLWLVGGAARVLTEGWGSKGYFMGHSFLTLNVRTSWGELRNTHA